jgi:hypothetical protein
LLEHGAAQTGKRIEGNRYRSSGHDSNNSVRWPKLQNFIFLITVKHFVGLKYCTLLGLQFYKHTLSEGWLHQSLCKTLLDKGFLIQYFKGTRFREYTWLEHALLKLNNVRISFDGCIPQNQFWNVQPCCRLNFLFSTRLACHNTTNIATRQHHKCQGNDQIFAQHISRAFLWTSKYENQRGWKRGQRYPTQEFHVSVDIVCII